VPAAAFVQRNERLRFSAAPVKESELQAKPTGAGGTKPGLSCWSECSAQISDSNACPCKQNEFVKMGGLPHLVCRSHRCAQGKMRFCSTVSTANTIHRSNEVRYLPIEREASLSSRPKPYLHSANHQYTHAQCTASACMCESHLSPQMK
jgi:hypothetical protein